MTIHRLISPSGKIEFGLYDEPVMNLNYMDYDLKTPLGLAIPTFLKKLKFNQFHFIGVAGEELMAGVAVVDLKYAANAFFYVLDRKQGLLTEEKKTTLSHNQVSIAPFPESPASRFKTQDLSILLTGDTVIVRGKKIRMELTLDTAHTTPLRICTRSGYRGWTYTQKTSPVGVSGFIEWCGKKIALSSPGYMGIVDWTGGFMRRETFWNWASGAMVLPDGKTLGFNFSCGTNETGFNENVFWVDGHQTRTGPVHFRFMENDFRGVWTIQSSDGKVDLVFYPETHRTETINAVVFASKFTQIMGAFDGRLSTDQDATNGIFFKKCPGWAEDHYAKW